MKRYLLSVALCLATLAHADRPKLEFKGLKPGGLGPTSKAWKCELKDQQPTTCFSMEETIAGVTARSVFVRFDAGLVKSVLVDFNSDDFDRVSEALLSKYGEPNNKRQETLKNRMGATFENVIMTWMDGTPEISGTAMSLRRYTKDVTSSALFISTVPKLDDLKRNRAEGTKKNSDDL